MLEYGPYAFMFWDDIDRTFGWQDRSKLDQELERKSIEWSKSPEYALIKKRRKEHFEKYGVHI